MRGLLKTWLWMLALSLAVGLAIGTCVRRESERPARFIGEARPEWPEAPGGSRYAPNGPRPIAGSSPSAPS